MSPHCDSDEWEGGVDLEYCLARKGTTVSNLNHRASLVVSVQNYLGESEASKKNAAMPGYLSIGMSLLALGTTYMPLFIPPPQAKVPVAVA